MTESGALAWIADLFEEPAANIQIETKREDVPAWDSLGVLVLIAGLDEKFDVRLSESEILELRRAGDIVKLLQARGAIG